MHGGGFSPEKTTFSILFLDYWGIDPLFDSPINISI